MNDTDGEHCMTDFITPPATREKAKSMISLVTWGAFLTR